MEQGKNFNTLVELFRQFPGTGNRQAERFTRFVVKTNENYIRTLLHTIEEARKQVQVCPVCFVHHEEKTKICSLCKREDSTILIIVEKESDVFVIESSLPTGDATYRYFVLGGCIPIAKNIQPHIRINEAHSLVRKMQPKEIILAFSFHPDADHTTRYLAEKLKKEFPGITLSTLGRGLSSGLELEYSSPDTLLNAFESRVSGD